MPSWSSPSRQKVIVIGQCVFRRLNECTVVGLHRITSRTISTSPRMCDPLGGASGAGGDATPARRTFLFDQKILVSSEFDSGNLANVEKVETVPGGGADPALEFNLWTLRDNDGGERPGKCDSWFYFSVRGVDGDTRLRFNLMKFKQKNLFNQGWVPVFRTSQTPNKTFSRLRDKPKLRKDTVRNFPEMLLYFDAFMTSLCKYSPPPPPPSPTTQHSLYKAQHRTAKRFSLSIFRPWATILMMAHGHNIDKKEKLVTV